LSCGALIVAMLLSLAVRAAAIVLQPWQVTQLRTVPLGVASGNSQQVIVPMVAEFKGLGRSLAVVPSQLNTCAVAQADAQALSTFTPSVDAAVNARPSLQTWLVANNIQYSLGVELDTANSVTYLDVVADDGTVNWGTYTVSDSAEVQIELQTKGLYDPLSPTGMSYNGIPVEVSTIGEGEGSDVYFVPAN
jgi:hypothetical protein